MRSVEAPSARQFCDILAAAMAFKLPGYWKGSIYRKNACGMIVGPLILSNEWNTHDYCYASFMTEPRYTTTPSNSPASWGGDPHPHPVRGEEFRFYNTGRWLGEDGPWRALLIETLERIEVQLADRRLDAEWDAAHKAIDIARKARAMWGERRAKAFDQLRGTK